MNEQLESGSRSLRYASLLAALVALLASSAIVQASAAVSVIRGVVSTAVLVAALFSAGLHGRKWLGILLLALAALVAGWVHRATDSRAAAVIDLALSSGFLALVTAALFASLLRSARVTTDTILGGVCVYLLLGAVFLFAFALLETLAPGSLVAGGVPLSDAGGDFSLLYYSFVTLTTLGYGDIVPRSQPARALAATEAVMGQLYVAIFVARLVGLHLAQQRRA